MVATTPLRAKGPHIDKTKLDVQPIMERAIDEELSEEMRGPESEQPVLSLPESMAKPAKPEEISIGKESIPGKEISGPEIAEEPKQEKKRSYIADVKDAIKKSMQKARERSKKQRSEREESVEKRRAVESKEEDTDKKRSSLAAAATVGLFTPLQLVF